MATEIGAIAFAATEYAYTAMYYDPKEGLCGKSARTLAVINRNLLHTPELYEAWRKIITEGYKANCAHLFGGEPYDYTLEERRMGH